MRVRTHNDINQWFKFFLTGVVETAKNGVDTFDNILQIQKSLDDLLKPLGNRSGDARLIINEMFSNPIINAAKVERVVGKSAVSAYKLISDMEDLGILKEITGGQRGKIYMFEKYVQLFK